MPEVIINNQVLVAADGATVIAANTTKRFRICSLAVLGASATAVNFYLYNGDNPVFYSDTYPLAVDRSGVAGIVGVVLPFQKEGWFETDTINEALKAYLSASVPVNVLLTYIPVF